MDWQAPWLGAVVSEDGEHSTVDAPRKRLVDGQSSATCKTGGDTPVCSGARPHKVASGSDVSW